ncbi:MAG: hypothetical protein OEM96_06810, partial [Gemmatimonadota bacterium]|nr:hypothetical protein [Gemmatimonadota bacterium]
SYTGAWTAVAPDGTVYATDDVRMYALSSDGGLLWVLDGAGGGRPISLDAEGTIYTALGRIVQAIDPAGTPVWSFDPGDSTSLVTGPGLGPDGHLYAAQDLGLGAFSLTTGGELRWDDPGDPTILSFSGGNWRTSFGDDRVYFPVKINASAAPALWVFEPSGNQRWYSGDLPENFGSAAQLDPFGRLIVIWGQVGMMAVSPDGEVIWVATPASPIGTLVRPAVGPDGTVYTASFFGSDFWAIHPDGTTRFLIENGPYEQMEKLAVTPDGDVVLAGNQAGFGLGGAISGYDAVTGALTFRISLTDAQGLSQSVWAKEPSYSPDGGIAYVTTRFAGEGPPGVLYAVAVGPSCGAASDLRLASVEGGSAVWLTWGDTWDAASYSVHEDLQPDGDFSAQTGTAPSGSVGLTVPMPVESKYYRVTPQCESH